MAVLDVSSRRHRRPLLAASAAGAALLVGLGVLTAVPAGAVAPSADLSVSVSHTPSSVTAPADVTFTVTVSNAGPDTATGVAAGIGFDYPFRANTLPSECRRTASYNSVICTMADIPSGSSGSVNLVLSAQGSGLFTLPVAISSDTADPDTSDWSASDSLLVKPGPTQGERWVAGEFPVIMERTPNAATIAYWAQRWRSEYFGYYPRDMALIPSGIMNSSEYRRLRVREAYVRILGRAADTSSLTYWASKLAAGTSYEQLEASLLSSREFATKKGSGRVAAAFEAVFRRAPSSAEKSTWTSTDAAKGPRATALLMQRSTEGFNVAINDRFQRTLGRAPSQLERYIWQVGLRNGKSVERLWSELLVSYEVMEKYPMTEDEYGYEEYSYAVPLSSLQDALRAS